MLRAPPAHKHIASGTHTHARMAWPKTAGNKQQPSSKKAADTHKASSRRVERTQHEGPRQLQSGKRQANSKWTTAAVAASEQAAAGSKQLATPARSQHSTQAAPVAAAGKQQQATSKQAAAGKQLQASSSRQAATSADRQALNRQQTGNAS